MSELSGPLDQSGATELAGSVDQLVDWMRAGEKPPERWLVGTEHEKLGIERDTLRRVGYSGARGIAELLDRIAGLDGWNRVLEGESVIALEKDGASITLEPGGQLELSGAPLRTIFETCAEFHAHLELVRQASEPADLVWLSLGIDPFHGVADAPRMPKARYEIMRDYLPSRGELALHMMHLTTTVQANLDFASEEDMVDKVRMASGVTPIVSALFANSSLAQGKPSGFASRRLEIWRHTDPDRCGLLPFVFEPDFGYRRYADWALDVPMFFIVRDGRYLAATSTTFRRFLVEGFQGLRATIDDWARHLTTLFPEVRLKRVIEVRGADGVPPGLICALPALWKGLLYDREARSAAWALVAEQSFQSRVAALAAVARGGLAAEVDGQPVLEFARELVAIAAGGLRRIGHGGGSESDERRFLEPLHEVLERGRSDGEEIVSRWEGEWDRSTAQLVEYARY